MENFNNYTILNLSKKAQNTLDFLEVQEIFADAQNKTAWAGAYSEDVDAFTLCLEH